MENPIIEIERRAAEAGIPLNQLCEAVPVARSTLTRWKNGSTGPQWRLLKKIDETLKKMEDKNE